MTNLPSSSFIVVDLETTGLKPDENEIIEIGMVKYKDGTLVDTYSKLFKPKKALPVSIKKLTGISDDDLSTAPKLKENWQEVRDFIGDSLLIAHNAEFDITFLKRAAKRNEGLTWEPPHLDSCELGRILIPRLRDHRLATLADYFLIHPEEEHRALTDAKVTAEIVLKLIRVALSCSYIEISQIAKLAREADSKELANFFESMMPYLVQGPMFQPEPEKTNPHLLVTLTNHKEFKGTKPPANLDVTGILGENGELAQQMDGYEFRPQQIDMAKAVQSAMHDGYFLVVEAGTGIGKSLAYLIPGLHRSLTANERIVISTNTKNLQEQLFFNDIPLIGKYLNWTFRAELLKGSSNYICLARWRKVAQDPKLYLSQSEIRLILPIVLWVNQTKSGDKSENNGFPAFDGYNVWEKLYTDTNACTGPNCPFYQECYLYKGRKLAKMANLVVVNHALLFSDLAMDNALIGDYTTVILDEAHNIEKVAQNTLSIEFHIWRFRRLLRRLYHKENIEFGLAISIEQSIQRWDIGPAKLAKVQKSVKNIKENVRKATKSSDDFFETLSNFLRAINIPDVRAKLRYDKDHSIIKAIENSADALEEDLSTLNRNIKEVIEIIDNLDHIDELIKQETNVELDAIYKDLGALIGEMTVVTKGAEKNRVFWAESPSRPSRNDAKLIAAPLEVSDILHDKFYKKLNAAVLTSATLAVENDFTYLAERIGLHLVQNKHVETMLLGSPFDFHKQSSLIIPGFLPSPKSEDYDRQMLDALQELLLKLNKGTLVLFTNYQALNKAYYYLKDALEAENILLLAQNIDGTRFNVTQRFKEDPRSVLLGTDSFWEGVDIPGEALEALIITKLPFAVPTEPLVEATIEQLTKQGIDAFRYYSIPQAVLKLRQGFGRLIRTKEDHGVVVILDNRTIKANYGRTFLKSLPSPVKIVNSMDETIEWAKQY